MFQDKFRRPVRYAKLVWIAYQVRRGIIPKNVKDYEIGEALRITKPPNVLEMFGVLRLKHFIKRGYLWSCEDHGIVSVQKVTTAFANYLVDALQVSPGSDMQIFTFHDMGDDATADANTQTALLNSRETRANGNQLENAANQYSSIATITATASYTVNEHGLFSAVSAGTMMDRNAPITSPPAVVADDQVEFTYELTVNAE